MQCRFESCSWIQYCCGDRNGYGLACKASICGFESRPQLQYALVAQLEERRISTPGLRGFESCRERHRTSTVVAREGGNPVNTDRRCSINNASVLCDYRMPLWQARQHGELAERQGTAVLTRRDLRVGQVRLLHSPPVSFFADAGVAQWQSRWLPPRRCGFDSRCPLHSIALKT